MSWLELRVLPVVTFLLTAAAMYVVSLYTNAMVISALVRWGSIAALAVLGLVVGVSGVLEFRRVRTTVNPSKPHAATALVTSGVYRWTRNPMYVALTLGLAAWAVFLGSPYSLLLVAAFVSYMTRFQIQPEERALQQQFGAEFLAYKHRVRRWV